LNKWSAPLGFEPRYVFGLIGYAYNIVRHGIQPRSLH